jgi:hypothetical protein
LSSLLEKGGKKTLILTLILTLSSPLEKGGKKKDLDINPGQPVGKRREKKKP